MSQTHFGGGRAVLIALLLITVGCATGRVESPPKLPAQLTDQHIRDHLVNQPDLLVSLLEKKPGFARRFCDAIGKAGVSLVEVKAEEEAEEIKRLTGLASRCGETPAAIFPVFDQARLPSWEKLKREAARDLIDAAIFDLATREGGQNVVTAAREFLSKDIAPYCRSLSPQIHNIGQQGTLTYEAGGHLRIPVDGRDLDPVCVNFTATVTGDVPLEEYEEDLWLNAPTRLRPHFGTVRLTDKYLGRLSGAGEDVTVQIVISRKPYLNLPVEVLLTAEAEHEAGRSCGPSTS